MGDHSIDFVNQFYSLEGDSIPDIKKKFCKFLRQPQFAAHKNEIHKALDQLEPKNYLQGLLKVDALIHFRKADVLLDHLQKGTNEIYTSKIIKQKWLLEEVFGSLAVDKFVNDFLPQTSFSTRMKLIKRMSVIWNGATVDQLYDELLKRYGFCIANIVLDKCSPEKFKDVLTENETTLTPDQVIHLFHRDIELFKVYVSHYKKLKGKLDEKKVFDYVALKNPELLMFLQKQGLISYRMGRRITKKVYPLIKDDIDNAEEYLKFMDKSVLVRRWGDKFQIVFQKLFPTEINRINIYSDTFQLLKFYPKSKRWTLFLNVFSQNIGLDKLPKAYIDFNDRFLTLCNPTKEAIQIWASENYKTNSYNIDYLKYYETPMAIKMLKEIINVTSDFSKREDLLRIMVSACAENNDLKALEGVLKYLCVRHRNEEYYVKHNILAHVMLCFKMESLTQSHWQYINEQINVLRVQQKHDRNVCKDLTQHYLEFLLRNKQPFEDVLIQYIKDIVSLQYSFDFSLKDPSVISILYKECIQLYSKAIDISDKDYFTYFSNLIERTVNFERENTKYIVKLDELTSVLDFALKIFGKSDSFNYFDFQFITSLIEHHLLSSLNSIDEDTLLQAAMKIYGATLCSFPQFIYSKAILKKKRNNFENKILKMYFEIIFDRQADKQVLGWFLVNEPSVLVPYSNKIIRQLIHLQMNNKQILAMKYYPQLNLDGDCCIFYKNLLKDIELLDENHIVCSMKYLSLLLKGDEFVAIVNDKFLPKKDKLDLEDAKMSQFYKPQCAVIKKLHRVQEPNKLLPLIIKFCIGDYLKSAIPPLYSLFYRCPEWQLYDKIDSLSKGAVSVKKHALFLSCQLLDCQKITKLFINSASSKSSEQKHVFSSLFKYFKKNPSESLFDLVIKNLYTIDKNDTEILDSLKDAQLPRKYQVQFLEECWAFYESLKKHDVKITSYLDLLLYHVVDCREVIENLSKAFIAKIINTYFRDVEEDLSNIEQFISRILRYRLSEQTSNFETVFDILKSFARDRLYNFFSEFDSINRTDVDVLFIERFYDHWRKYFLVKDAFRETVGLQLLLFYHKSKNNQIYAQNIIEYMEKLSSAYGPYTLTLYAQILKKHVEDIEEGKIYQLYLDILNYKNNLETCTLILTIMEKPSNKMYEVLYNEVRKVIATSEDTFVQLYYNNFK